MNNKRMTFGTGIALAVLAMFVLSAVPTVNAATAYFVPEDDSAETGGYQYMSVYVDIPTGETLGGADLQINFNPAHVNITKCKKVYKDPTGSDQYCFNVIECNVHYTPNGYLWSGTFDPCESVWDPEEEEWVWEPTSTGWINGPATVWVVKYKVEAQGTPGVSSVDFGKELQPGGCTLCLPCNLINSTAKNMDNVTWINGTFTHIGQPETFEKELVEGWNLVSLPLTPLNNSTSAVLGNDTFAYDSVYRYNAETKLFEDVTTGTMDPGIGYFVNVTTAGTWSYVGTSPYNSMSIELKQGLNLVGWLNCTKQISGNLTSIAGKYNYNARWNAGYEVYEPQAPEVFNDFEMMERGEGYWIAAKEDCTLTVSCSG